MAAAPQRRDYTSPSYWDERYKKQEAYDWYKPWSEIQPEIASLLTGAKNALYIGCGNSPMGAELADSFECVVNIDLSPVVIDQMKEKYCEKENVEWIVMDVQELEYPDNSFDVVFDKGTIDALLIAVDPLPRTRRALQEIHRVLKKGGHFIDITAGNRTSRSWFFDNSAIPWKAFPPVEFTNRPKGTGDWYWIAAFEKIEDTPPDGEPNADDAPAGDAPADDAPAGDAPADDAPAGDAPADDAPAGDAPADDAPADDTS